MTTKQQYNYEYLQQFCDENNITLSKDYSQEKINRDTKIEGTCKTNLCNELFCKTFRQLDKIGGFCKDCTLQNGKNKSIETCLQKYGSTHTLQVKSIRDKGKETCLEKYGDINYNNRDKYKKTCQKLFKCNNPSQNEIIKAKKIETCLINNGVEHPLQNEIIFNKSLKSGYKYKSYTYPSGNIIEIQGYEPYALDDLLQKENILEENIVVGTENVPEIWYLDSNSKKHRYYVDVFIPSQNRMIEVKSTYTIKLNNDTILLKQQACKDAGYSCEIWVYNSKGEKVECIL